MNDNKKLAQVLFITLLLVLPSFPVYAWKPYTHIYSSDQARNEVIADGHVIINGRRYKVREEIAQALTRWPEYFNSGVVGPDGFPDLTYGQSIIHPEETGLWLRHVYVKAWKAQADPMYTADQRGQILAFTYGYLAHAAGDMWAHTLVNDFARGVFPSFKKIPREPLLRDIAIRHVLVEAYVGDATPGYDGNPERTRLPDGDWSDDGTNSIRFAVPKEFVYNALIQPTAGTPTKDASIFPPERGPMIDVFLKLQTKLRNARANLKLDTADDESLDVLLSKVDRFENACLSRKFVTDYEQCQKEFLSFKVGVRKHIGENSENVKVRDVLKKLPKLVLAAYLRWWETQIDNGLKAWGEFGLATTKAFFDPQARRNAQNRICKNAGDDRDAKEEKERTKCERDVKMSSVLDSESDEWVRKHLFTMLGLPPGVSNILKWIRQFDSWMDEQLRRLKPAELENWVEGRRNDLIERLTGVNVQAAEYLLKHPAAWLGVPRIKVKKLEHEVELFATNERQRLDRYMGFTGNDHLVSDEEAKPYKEFPYKVTRLDDEKGVFDQVNFPAMRNTETMVKLALLDGDGLNEVIRDELGPEAAGKCWQLYPSERPLDAGCSAGSISRMSKEDTDLRIPANIMINSYPPSSNGAEFKLWLRSIDSDHAWRKDGQPRFQDEPSLCKEEKPDEKKQDEEKPIVACAAFAESTPCPRCPKENGGNGTFPLWTSCVGRQAFRTLFHDWEGIEFPDYGDRCH